MPKPTNVASANNWKGRDAQERQRTRTGRTARRAPTHTGRTGSTEGDREERNAKQKKKTPEATSCDPNYEGACLQDGIGDYDCAGGSGNGPNYVAGPIYVIGADPFGLDRDGDGVACEG